jgi:23S rRNA pseudouridine2605 synthase
MTNNENGQGNRKPGAGAGRDGKPYERRDVKSILKGTRGAAKYSDQPGESSERPYRQDSNRRDDNRSSYERKPNDGNSFDRKPYERRPVDGNSYERKPYERKPYDGNSFDRKPYDRKPGEGNSYDRKPYERRPNDGNSYERRPYDNRNNDGNSYERKPYDNRNNDGNSYERKPYENRPNSFVPRERKSFDDRKPFERSYNNDRPYDGERSPGMRPRFKPKTDGQQGDGGAGTRQRFTVKKSPESASSGNYVEARFDNVEPNRRPRIKRTGDYDPNSKYSKKKQFEYRRSEVDFTKPVRLNKFLANAGICSRREADEFIKAGVITVNGEFVTEMGVKVMHSDKVMFHNQLVRSEKKVYILLNKPKDTVTTAEDTHDRRTVMDLVKNACSERIYPVGRLDRNTTGVLLLTNDGDLASKLTHPKYEKKKIYQVVLDKPLAIPDFEAVMAGVVLDDEKIAADSLNFIKDDDFRYIGIEIHSGQNRVVRRIFEKLGYKVVRLDRVYFAGLTKKNLPRGKYRFLSEREVNMLRMGAYE